ncbi:MAG: hypothetical protein ACR2NB_04545, partial [Solirubrobacteraceae bacterium]
VAGLARETVKGGSWRMAAVGAALVLIVGVNWTARTADDARTWDEAWRIEQDILGVARATIPDPAPGTSIFLFGAPRATRAEVPVFFGTEDLGPALRLQLHGDVSGIPMQGATRVVCRREGPGTVDGFLPPQSGARYGKTVFLDYGGRRALPVPDRQTCRALAPTLASGPISLYP